MEYDANTLYRNAVAKGQRLLNMMLASDSVAGSMLDPPQPSASNQFLDQSSLQDWGYTRALHPFEGFELKFTDTLTALGLSPPCPGTMHIRDLHATPTIHEGASYPHTLASFTSYIDRTNGLLIASHNHSPAFMLAESETSDCSLPQLRHWSDIAYLQWTDPRLHPSPSTLPRYVIRLHISNADTLAVIDRILADYREEHRYWVPDAAGLSWDVETEEAKALLGTPNGSGVAWMLVQRKGELGGKVVENVTLFWDHGGFGDLGDGRDWPSLLVRIGDVEGEERGG